MNVEEKTPLKLLEGELEKTAVISESFKGTLFAHGMNIARDAYDRGLAEGVKRSGAEFSAAMARRENEMEALRKRGRTALERLREADASYDVAELHTIIQQARRDLNQIEGL